MTAEMLYGILFMVVVVVIVIAGGSYMWATREKPAPPPPPRPAPTLTPQNKAKGTDGVYIPPEVARTVGTIKQIAESEPELIENVLRGWIKGEEASGQNLRQELQNRKRQK